MMKNFAIAAISTCAAVCAHAQNSVTLYGVIDDGLTYVNNSGKGAVVGLTSSIAQGSRWGLTGLEDLGGGYKAIFKLENGFNVNNGKLGSGGLEFGRSAYVGISSDKLGTFTIGRQYDAIPDYYALTSMNGNWGAYFAHANDIDNSNSTFRVNNSLKYSSLSYAGLQFEVLYALGGVAGSTTANSTISTGIRYVSGPLYLAAVYMSAKTPSTQFADGNWVANQVNPSTNGAFGYAGNPSNMQVAAGGGTYQIGQAKVGLDYSNIRFGSANGTQDSVVFSNYEVWGQYAFTPSTTVALGYTFTPVKVNYLASGDRPKYNQINLMIDYLLSRKTDVYFAGVFEKTSGGAKADIYNAYPSPQSSTTTQVLARIGIRTKF